MIYVLKKTISVSFLSEISAVRKDRFTISHLRVCHLEPCKITLKSFLAIALNTKFVPGRSIFLVCRTVASNFLGDLGLTFLPTTVVA